MLQYRTNYESFHYAVSSSSCYFPLLNQNILLSTPFSASIQFLLFGKKTNISRYFDKISRGLIHSTIIKTVYKRSH